MSKRRNERQLLAQSKSSCLEFSPVQVLPMCVIVCRFQWVVYQWKCITFTFVTLLNLYLQLFRPSYGFNLTDPYCRLLENQYRSLHDPHLKAYYRRKDVLRRLKKGGYITNNNKVGWRRLFFKFKPSNFGVCLLL